MSNPRESEELTSFGRRLGEAMESAGRQSVWSTEDSGRYMAEITPRLKLFGELSERIVSSIIRPRVLALAALFPQARPGKNDQPGRFSCWFFYMERFPVNARLEFSVDHDQEIRQAWVASQADVSPLFERFDDHDTFRFALDAFEAPSVSAWVEERLLVFLQTYLRYDRGSDDEAADLVSDPVCGMRISRAAVAAVEHYSGHPYHFCSQECRERFVRRPEQYIRFELL